MLLANCFVPCRVDNTLSTAHQSARIDNYNSKPDCRQSCVVVEVHQRMKAKCEMSQGADVSTLFCIQLR